MSQVTVNINGREFRMSCEDGQEDHLLRLAKDLDGRIVKLRDQFGEIGDLRLTVMAALTMADALAETEAKVARLASELSALEETRVNAAHRANATQAAIATALDSAAERIEALTRKLNQTTGGGDGIAQG